MRARTLPTLLAAVCLTATSVVFAEVSAKIDDSGTYVGMVYRYNSNTLSPRIWTAGTSSPSRKPLNPLGDLYSDLAPTVVENPLSSRWPTVVWSHPTSGRYALVFSRWNGSQWSPIQSVRLGMPANEFEPRVAFNSKGHEYMVWTSLDQTGSVYFSIFLTTRWMTPILVSAPGLDARHPTLSVLDDSLVQITFETSSGTVTRSLMIPSSDTITDDIDPKLRADIQIGY